MNIIITLYLPSLAVASPHLLRCFDSHLTADHPLDQMINALAHDQMGNTLAQSSKECGNERLKRMRGWALRTSSHVLCLPFPSKPVLGGKGKAWARISLKLRWDTIRKYVNDISKKQKNKQQQ